MTRPSGAQGLRTLLSHDERAALGQVTVEHRISARSDVFEEGGGGEHVHILLEGWAARYRDLPDGRRQILSLHFPGDVCDLDGVMLKAVDFGVEALTACKIGRVALVDLQAQFDARPRLAIVFWWMLAAENAIACAWTNSLGSRRSATPTYAGDWKRTTKHICRVASRWSPRWIA